MGHWPGGHSSVSADIPSFSLLRRAGGGARRWGTPVASYVAGLSLPDARHLDRGKPRDEDTEGGNQPADKSLINRRLSLHSQPCTATPFLQPAAISSTGCSAAP
jgi:hypothetical protein